MHGRNGGEVDAVDFCGREGATEVGCHYASAAANVDDAKRVFEGLLDCLAGHDGCDASVLFVETDVFGSAVRWVLVTEIMGANTAPKKLKCIHD